jgi:hypothetical protein
MSQEKKPQVDDLTKLRRILDNSSDPTLESLLSTNEEALESVRRRLRGDTLKTPLRSAGFFPRYSSMKPRVFVREQTPVSPRLIPPSPTVEPPAPLPKFEVISTSEPPKDIPSQEQSFDSEDLIEVEKVDRTVPEFVEVTPEEPSPSPEEKDTQRQDDETPAHEPDLPEWQPVTEEQQTEHLASHGQLSAEPIPEFERVSVPPTAEKPETPLEKEPLPEKESLETAVGPTEPPEPSFQILLKWQKLKEKRAKERQAKKLEKIELKRSKKAETQEEEQTMEEQPPFPPPQEESQTTSEPPHAVETPWIKVDVDTFKGIESIDETTAELLYTHGYFSIENIKDATLDDLVQIRGIRRKLAKQIKREIEQKSAIPKDTEFIPIKQKPTKKKSTKKLQDAAEWESYPVTALPKQSSPPVCRYKGYTLFKRETKTRNRKKTTLHFFSKEKPDKGQPVPLPDGYQIAVNKKTGVPYLKKTH